MSFEKGNKVIEKKIDPKEAYKQLKKQINYLTENYYITNKLRISNLLTSSNNGLKEVLSEWLRYKEIYYNSAVDLSEESYAKYNKKSLDLICKSIRKMI